MSECIFRRCQKCDKLFLYDEKHKCQPKASKSWDLAERIFQILDARGEPTNQADICREINRELGRQKYTQFEIAYSMRKRPRIFSESKRCVWKLTIWECA